MASDERILVTVFLRHDQSKPLEEIMAHTKKTGFYRDFPPEGCELVSWVVAMSFGFIIQLGFGSYGTPAHSSPGALIAANRDALFADGTPLLFWLPSLLLVAISTAFLLMLNNEKDTAA